MEERSPEAAADLERSRDGSGQGGAADVDREHAESGDREPGGPNPVGIVYGGLLGGLTAEAMAETRDEGDDDRTEANDPIDEER
jgi:hypothetical protein